MAFPRNRIRTIVAGATIAMASAALLAGCSSSSPSSEEGGSSGDAQVAPPIILKEGKLTVCSGDSPPNVFYDENNELQGVEIDIAGALADELGLKLALEEYDFSGLIPALQAKQCDVIMGSLYIKPEREEIANFVPYLYSGTGVGVAKENPRNVTGFDESLCGIKTIAITGATGGNGAEELSAQCEADGKPPVDLVLVNDGASAIQQVLAGQVDAFIDTSEIMSFYEQQTDGSFMMVGDPVGKIRIGAATLKDNTDLNQALDTAFQAIVDNGTYHSILEKWGVESNDVTQPE